VSCLKCGDEFQAMFLVADRNLQRRHWARMTAEPQKQPWCVNTLGFDPSTAPGFVSKYVHAVAASQSGTQNFCVYLFVHRNVWLTDVQVLPREKEISRNKVRKYMTYRLSRIIISRSESCNGSNVVAKSMNLICTQVKNLANLAVVQIRQLVLLVRGVCWVDRHLTSPSPSPSPASSPSGFRFALSCFTSCSGLVPILSACLFWKFSCVKSRTSFFYPVTKHLTQNFCSRIEYLKCWGRVKAEFRQCMPST